MIQYKWSKSKEINNEMLFNDCMITWRWIYKKLSEEDIKLDTSVP